MSPVPAGSRAAHWGIELACWQLAGGCYQHDHIHLGWGRPKGVSGTVYLPGKPEKPEFFDPRNLPEAKGGKFAVDDPPFEGMKRFFEESDWLKRFPQLDLRGPGKNARVVAGTETWSEHAYYEAQEPYAELHCRARDVFPPSVAYGWTAYKWLLAPFQAEPPPDPDAWPGRTLYYDPDNLMHGEDVRRVKSRLRSLGWAKEIGMPIDDSDVAGKAFDLAVRGFQNKHDLTVDGRVGRVTWNAIFNV